MNWQGNILKVIFSLLLIFLYCKQSIANDFWTLDKNISSIEFEVPVLFLGMDMATLTASGNDLGYDKIFSRSLDGLGRKNDILICFSTSGKSKNIIKAINVAKKMKILSIGFLGQGGGYAKKLIDEHIIVPSNNVMRIQESHLFLTHYLAELIEEKLTLHRNNW